MPKSVLRNKDLSYDIARACKIPIDTANKVLSVMLEWMVRELKKNKILKIRGWGIFRLFVAKRCNNPKGGYTSQKNYKCRFSPKGPLSIMLRNKWFRKYEWHLANKYKRLKKEGKKKEAKKIKNKIKMRLANNRSMERWLWERGRLPYPFDPNESGASKTRETEK